MAVHKSNNFHGLKVDDSKNKFDFEEYVINNLGLDIYGENKKNTQGGVCIPFLRNRCTRGIQCPYKHIRAEKAVVCKHWLRGLCKKEDQCEFLHQYNLKLMPECWFYSKYGECASAEECMYLHIDPETKIPECAWFNRGFCKHGPTCNSKHVRKIACPLFLAGFCPKGPECENGHSKFEIPPPKDNNRENNFANNSFSNQNPRQNMDQFDRPSGGFNNPNQNYNQQNRGTTSNRENKSNRPLSEVTCFKCNQQGHYANHCNNRVN